ncbi:nuclear transport factor 2 family protein [Mycobacterium sp. NPDC003449]
MTGVEALADKLAITELLYRYAELIDSGDFDGVGRLLGRATFAGTASQATSGERAIAKLFASTTRRYPDHGNTPRTRHLVLNPIVDLDGARARARSTFLVLQNTGKVALAPIVAGRYLDTFARDEQGWFFTERRVDVEMLGDVSAHLMLDPGAFGR